MINENKIHLSYLYIFMIFEVFQPLLLIYFLKMCIDIREEGRDRETH